MLLSSCLLCSASIILTHPEHDRADQAKFLKYAFADPDAVQTCRYVFKQRADKE